MTVGVLALQGDVREHAAAFDDVGSSIVAVRKPEHLEGVAGLVLPGGESTTMSFLLESSGLLDPVAAALHAGLPAFGTCAGLVLLSTRVLDGRPDQQVLGALDCTVRRNAYGRQRESFEGAVRAPSVAVELGEEEHPIPAVFIRAPVVVQVGAEAEVLGLLDGEAGGEVVVLRQGEVLATSFHPELTRDRRLHRFFVRMVKRAGKTVRNGEVRDEGRSR